jgi:kynureninase
LDRIAAACRTHGAALLVDAYHHLNVIPFDVGAMALEDAWVTGGGYKYCQLGEGNAFLRVPPGTTLRPVLTGWFAEFEELEQSGAREVAYGSGAAAFAGATYDPTSHYRGAAVFDFHQQQQLTPERLRAINQAQVALLETTFLELDLDPRRGRLEPVAADRRGGFLALRTPAAAALVAVLRARAVYVDARGDIVRIGPAPYVSDRQLRDGVEAIGEWLKNA